MEGTGHQVTIEVAKVKPRPMVGTDPAEREDLAIDVREDDLISIQIGQEHLADRHIV
jgi:hypothetical protein